MKQEVKIGQQDYTVLVVIRDTAGAPKTALAYNSGGLDICYTRVETDNDVVLGDGAPATQTLTGSHTDWGFVLVENDKAPGLYRLDIADEVFATGAWSAVVSIIATGCTPTHLEFVLVPEAPYTGVNVSMISNDADAANNAELFFDGTGYAGTNNVIPTVTTVTNQLTAAAIATGVWQDATAGDFTTASSIGKALYVDNVAPGGAGGHFIAGTNAATSVTTALTANITGNLSGSVGSVAAGGIAAASFAAGAIDAAAIADAAIDNATFATDTVCRNVRSAATNGAGASTVTLDGSASSTNNYYDGSVIQITAGDGVGQSRVIRSYVGSTKIATVTEAWATQPTAATYVIHPLGDVEVGYMMDGTITSTTFASGAITAGAIATDAIGAAELAVDAVAEIADGIMTRASSNWEASAPVKSLGTAVMKAVHKTIDNAGTLEIYRSNSSTLHASQTIGTDAGNLPIDSLTGAV